MTVWKKLFQKRKKDLLTLLAVILIAAFMFFCSIIFYRTLSATPETKLQTATPEPAIHALNALRAAVATENGFLINAEVFKHDTFDGTTVAIILVQVRNSESDLARLLASLERVDEISSALLILSHATYDGDINHLARSVPFCRVMQLYYPYSVQLNPDRFPGPNARDCGERDADPEDCVPRDARLSERKHHWWWSCRYVFNQIPEAKDGAPVIMLEDQYVVAPDLLHMAKLSWRALTVFPAVYGVALGRPPIRTADASLLIVDAWRPAYAHGLMLNITLWHRICNLAVRYCMFNDSSWSQSLLNVFDGFPSGRIDVLVVSEPRVALRSAGVPKQRWKSERLFPRSVRVKLVWERGEHVVRWSPTTAAGGGWEDLRDQLFCLDPQINISDDESIDTNTTTTDEPASYDKLAAPEY